MKIQYFTQSEYLILPKPHVIGQRMDCKDDGNVNKVVQINVTGQVIPLRSTLKTVFELPEVFNDMMAYAQSLEIESDIISNFTQGQFWKSKMSNYRNSDESRMTVSTSVLIF